MAGSRLMCTFMVGDLYCGLEVERVQEVISYRRLTRVPLAPPEVLGLINLRGEIVTAIDLRRRLRLDSAAPAEEPMNVVARGEDGAFSFVVDRIEDVVELERDDFEATPETLDDGIRHLVQGVCKVEERLLLLLDVDRLLELD